MTGRTTGTTTESLPVTEELNRRVVHAALRMLSNSIRELGKATAELQDRVSQLDRQVNSEEPVAEALFLVQLPVSREFTDPFVVFASYENDVVLPAVGDEVDFDARDVTHTEVDTNDEGDVTFPGITVRATQIVKIDEMPVVILRSDPADKLSALEAVQVAAVLGSHGFTAESPHDGSRFANVYNQLCDGVL